MSNIAVLFAGQGAQQVGMGKDLYEAFPQIKAFYDRANAILGFSLTKISFEGPQDELTKTIVCQPALYVHGYALLTAAQIENPAFSFSAAAGLSLGEYTAHAAARTFDFESGLRLVHARARLMQEACEKTQGGMVALLGATPESAKAVADEAGIDVANYNAPGQIVLSGSKDRLPLVSDIIKKHGIKRAMPLPVAGAYHSRLMASAQEGLQPFLEQTNMQPPKTTVIANVNAQPVTTPEDVRATLARQVCGSVRWEECVHALLATGTQRLVEIGPSAHLAGFNKRIAPSVPCVSIGSLADLRANAASLA